MRIGTVVLSSLLTLTAVQAWGAAADNPNVIDKPILADTPAKFAATSAQVRLDMEKGGRYEFMRSSDKQRVDALLSRMAVQLDHAGSVSAMNHDAQIELFNEQEQVNGLLKHNDANRLVCESRAPVGSHLPVTTCRTFGEIERGRGDANKTIEDLNNLSRHQLSNGGGERQGN
jgi:hypothetical protein